jgi:hypothetical protein
LLRVFVGRKDSIQRIFIKKSFFMVGNDYYVKQFTTRELGLRNSTFKSCRWSPTRSPSWDCNRSNCVARAQGCSHGGCSENWMGLSLQHLLQYEDGEDMLNGIVTDDESWMHHYQPEIKARFSAMETSQFIFSLKVAEITVKRLLCCGFQRNDKAT